MKYYICDRKKWIFGASADKGMKVGELYRGLLRIFRNYLIIQDVPLLRSDEKLGDIVAKIRLVDEI